MKFCSKCDKLIDDNANVCPYCGCQVNNKRNVALGDSSSGGYALLGFCVPLVGLILWLVWKDDLPLRAKSAGKGALISVILSVVVYVIYFIIIAAAVSMY